jgi:hypothetical protein
MTGSSELQEKENKNRLKTRRKPKNTFDFMTIAEVLQALNLIARMLINNDISHSLALGKVFFN